MPLYGTLRYKLELSPHSSDWSRSSKKRPRNRNESSSRHNVGLYFINNHQQDEEFLLILPQKLQKRACDAARFNLEVKLNSYTKLQVNTLSTFFSVLEVHDFLLNAEIPYRPNNSPVLLTLPQVLEKELDATRKNKYFSFHATVDAISPIISLVPSDPFCLMELYDDESMQGCVLVLKGSDALSCHAAIQPGEVIRLHKVERLGWHVWEEMKHNTFLQQRVPRYVFVVTKAECIEWDNQNAVSSALPTTPLPLIALEGKVTKVDSKSHTIHIVGHINDRIGISTYILDLSHLPISIDIQVGMREGAVIRAVNIHVFPWSDPSSPTTVHCGTCLRSTLCLLELATKDIIALDDDHSRFVLTQTKRIGQQHTKTIVFQESLIAFRYGKVNSSYFGNALRSYLSKWKLEGASSAEIVKSVFHLLRNGKYAKGLNGNMLQQLVKMDDLFANLAGKRDPFMEFFGHALEKEQASDDTDTVQCGCYLSRVLPSRANFPCTLSLTEIKDISQSAFSQHLEGIMTKFNGSSNQDIKGGWTTSLQLTPKYMEMKMRREMRIEEPIMVFGTIHSMDDDNQPWSLENKTMRIPISFRAASKVVLAIGKVAALQLNAVLVSCICLGSYNLSAQDEKQKQEVPPHYADLKSWSSLGIECDTRNGSCALFRLNGLMFVVSFLVHGDAFFHSDAVTTDCAELNSLPSLTIHECLSPESRDMKHGTLTGLLCRQRFKFAKIRRNQFNACVLTLSHIPLGVAETLEANNISSLQSMELKISVSTPRKGIEEMLAAISRLLDNVSILEEQVALAVAWWKVADSANSAPIVAGGLDEFILPSHSVGLVSRLSVPISAIIHGRHGYVRFSCDVKQIQASLQKIETTSDLNSHGDKTLVTSVGGSKFLPGMLDRMPRRQEFASNDGLTIGERTSTSCFSGVSSATLAELHWQLCKDICNHTQFELAPSMVQLVRRAKLLSISFCRAQVECTMCFEKLIQRDRSISNKPMSGVVDCSPVPSFWNMPLPACEEKAGEQHRSCDHQTLVQPQSILRCSNDCPIDAAQVRWECSGVLDDTTGQAKLYAERGAALTLLGMTSEVQTIIEQGAWHTEVGLVFTRTSPAKAFVKQAIREAQRVAIQNLGIKYATDAHVLQLLTPLIRAEYYLHEHCRSVIPRPLHYYVRCKPIGAFHLNQTQIEMVTPSITEGQNAVSSHVATYSLPPLKLTLVDCVRVKNETRDASWELVKKMKA